VKELLPGVTAVGENLQGPGASDRDFVNYDNQGLVGAPLVATYARVSQAVAAQAAGNLAKVLACGPAEAAPACLERFVRSFGARAFRRPLDAVEVEGLLRVAKSQIDQAGAVLAVVQAVLQAPSFLYRVELGVPGARPGAEVALSSYERAAALSFFLLDSIPDAELWQAASSGALADAAGLERQVDRLLALPRVRAHLTDVLFGWLGTPSVQTVDRPREYAAVFNATLRRAIYEETLSWLDDLLWGGRDGTWAELFRSKRAIWSTTHFAPEAMSRFYGVPFPAGMKGTFPVELPPERAGVLARPGLIAFIPYSNRAVHRGKLLRTQFLCDEIPPPPPNLDTNSAATVGKTERESAELRAKNNACAFCHGFLDPPGLAFEAYDAIGRYVPTVNKVAVDASGVLTGSDVDGPFTTLVEFSAKLAGSRKAQACVAKHLLSYAAGRALTEHHACEVERVVDHLGGAGRGRLDSLFRAIGPGRLFQTRQVQE
jgi:hypothetical protein